MEMYRRQIGIHDVVVAGSWSDGTLLVRTLNGILIAVIGPGEERVRVALGLPRAAAPFGNFIHRTHADKGSYPRIETVARDPFIGKFLWAAKVSGDGAEASKTLHERIALAIEIEPSADRWKCDHVPLVPGDLSDEFELYELLDEIHPFWLSISEFTPWARERFPDEPVTLR